jgi:mannose-6-phosphate isomerase-like protein (cupin superfamily)
MNTIEKYEIKESGYHPFLIRDGWQVAQLNYDISQNVENIKKLDIHNHTDEVFILLKGTAVLITAILNNNQPQFGLEIMKPGITYNIPQKTWHNIAMEKGCGVIVVEKSNTHENDFEFFYLTEEKQLELRARIEKLTKKDKIEKYDYLER